MPDELHIRDILETYELSPELTDRLARIAARRINELGLTSPGDQYDYIAHLVDRFQVPYRERTMPHLEDPLRGHPSFALQSLIGGEDENLLRLIDSRGEGAELTANELTAVLEGTLDRTDIRVLHRLLEYAGEEFALNVSPEELLAEAPEIAARLEKMSHAYERNGRVVLPDRELVAVQFFPFKIKFRYRRYNGDPLAYYKRHPKYRGMPRGRLAEFDYPLYQALRVRGLIAEAIPECKSPLTEKEKRRIAEAYVKYNRSAVAAAKALGHDVHTILDHWRGAGLPIRRSGDVATYPRHLTESQRDEILRAHAAYKGNAYRASLILPYSRQTIMRHWRDAGLPAGKIGVAEVIPHRLTEEQVIEIVAAYPVYNGSATQASRNLPYSRTCITDYWRKAGLKNRT